MAIVKRFNKLLGLEKIDVLVDDRDTSRHIVITDMPESLPQGKSSFLIEVSPYMRKGIELQIDFIDSKGNSIYVEPVSNYLEGTSRTVSVEVYNTVAPGVATMIIVGELEGLPLEAGNYSEVQEIPDEFKGVYNVRLTKEVIINSAEVNVQPIKFYSSPKLTAVEKRFGTMEREVVSGEITSSAFSVIGKPVIQQPYSIFNSQEEESEALGAGVAETNDNQQSDPPDGDVKGDEADKEKQKQHVKKRSVRGNSRFKRSRRIRRRRSPEEYPYLFTIDDSNHSFTTKEIGGEIKFSNIDTSIYTSDALDDNDLNSSVTFNVVSDTNDENYPTHYTASIAKLENDKTAYVNTPFTKQDDEGNYRLLEMKATGKVHYTPEPSASYSITNIVSYADVTLSHLRTFSGEVFKAKVYVRAEGSFDDYKLLAEVPVESPELMVNANSVGIGERTGYFVSEADKNTYWDLFGGTNGLSTATSTSTASYDNSTMLDSVMVSGSTSTFTDQIRFELKDAYNFNLTKGIDYDLSFKAIGQKDTDGRALLMVYVSGSSMKQSSDLHYDDSSETEVFEPSQYGKRMGVLEVTEDIKKDFGLVRHNFNCNLTGDAKVQFRVIAGQWNLSDISVVPATDTGFSPSFVNFTQELPPELTHKRPETLEFLTEFYDINNNLADEVAVTTGSTFTGGNMVITGDDNVLEHNLFIGGDTTGSGIHMGGTSSTLPDDDYSDGATGSGFIRSIGYLGFQSASNSALGGKKGFMIYSGSVLPNSGEDYSGVGLELVGASGSLKFRTNPSVFDVQADSFFVGKSTTQFVSGSNEQIEISSSNFHLTPEGNVTMSGTITAAAGTIGGFTIEETKLTTTGIELAAATEDLFISSSAFKVDHDGNITASNIDLGGTISATSGDVGGWIINAGSLTAGAGSSAVTMSSANKIIAMGSGSTFNKGDLAGGFRVGIDTDGDFKFAVGSAASYIHADATGVSIKSDQFDVTASVAEIDVDVFKLSANNLFISSSGGGFISAGNPRPTGITGTNKGFYVQGDTGVFLAGNAAGGHIKFDGTNTSISSSAFFLGSPTQFISGSLGNIEISSSNFHLDNAGNVVMSGNVSATTGTIGGLTIGSTKLSSGTSYEISSSTNVNDPVSFISSSNFKVSAGGQVTASALKLSSGDVGGLSVAEGEISVGSILKFKDSGQITGSTVLFTGGKIAGWNISGNNLNSTGGGIRLNANGDNAEISINSHTFANEGIQLGYNSGNPRFFAGVAGNFIKYTTSDGVNIKTLKATISGSEITLETPKFFLGKKGTQFVSGSNNLIEISSSGFHLTSDGDVTASAILLGDKAGGNYLQFIDDTLSVEGDITVNSIKTPATIAGVASTTLNASSSISSDGFASFKSASIAGWNVTDEYIYKPISGNAAHQDYSRVYMSSAQDDAKNIGEGFTVYRKDEDVVAGETKIIRLGGLSNTTNLHHTEGEYGLQIIRKQPDGSGYENIVYIGGTTQQISGWNLSKTGFTDSTGAVQFSSTEASMSLGTGQEALIRGNSNSPFISLQPSVALASKAYGETGVFLGVAGGSTPLFSAVGSGGHVKFNGTAVDITATTVHMSGSSITLATPKFYFGESSNYISGSNGNIAIYSTGDTTLSGSSVNIQTPRFYLGESAQYVSGSNGNIEISSSNFHLDNSGDVIMSGKVTATSGQIAEWNLSSQIISSIDDNGGIKLDSYNKEITARTGSHVDSTIITLGRIGGSVGSPQFGLEGLDSTDSSKTLFKFGEAGNELAGWTISNTEISKSGMVMDSANKKLVIHKSTFGQDGIQLEYNSGNPRFYVGDGSSEFLKFDGSSLSIQTQDAHISGSSITLETPKFFLGKKGSQFVSGSNGNIEISSSQFHLQTSGDVTASSALFDGTIDVTGTGTIAGWSISSNRLADSTDEIRLDSNAKAISIKNHSFGQSGIQLQYNGGTTRFYVGNGSNKFITFNGTDVDIKTENLTASGSSVSIETPSFFFGKLNTNYISGSNNLIEISSSKFHLQNDGDVIMNDMTASNANISGKITATTGEVGGWDIGATTLSSNNLILDSSGLIETSDYTSNEKGWRISSANSGEAEFQNIKIRGTLSTAVFEKESVNAVGGQLYIANSTAITGSATVAATAATMSVANVGGFAANEILSAKKVDATSFATEYMLVQSSSRDFPSSEKDFRGKLYVVRGYRSGSLGASGSLGDTANISQSYEPGQVIVSTGKINTGYIRLNANPNDSTTPYMDIVERTGSGVYDVDLKARLGDLSGLSSGLLYGETSPGFGLFTENVFLQGAITATTGSFTGKVHVGTTDGIVIDGNAKKLYQGVATHGDSDAGFYMDSSGNFSLGDKLVWNGSSLTVTGAINITSGTGFATAESVSGSFATPAGVSGSAQQYGAGAAASSSAVQSNLDTVSGSIATDISASNSTQTSVSASTAARIVTDANNLIIVPADAPSGNGLFLTSNYLGYYNSGWNAFIQSNGNFLFKADANNLVSFGVSQAGGNYASSSNFVLRASNAFLSGSSINLLTERFFLGGSSQFISGSNSNIEISSSNFHLAPTGDVTMAGKVTSTEGSIGGFDIGSSQISSSTGGLILNADGGISGSKFLLQGGVITSDVTILGDLSANSIATPSTAPSPSASISSDGLAKFVSASIGGFDVDAVQINSRNNNLILHSSGQITASAVSMSGTVVADSGNIGGFIIDSSEIRDSDNLLRLKANGQITASAAKISGDITISSGDLAGVTATTISGSSDAVSSSLASDTAGLLQGSSSMATKVVLSGTDVRVKYDDNNYAKMDADSFDVVLGGQTSASFGADTTVGPTGGSHVLINSDSVSVKRGGVTFLSASAAGLDMSGSISATGGTIGGFTIGSDLSSTAGTLQLKGASGQITASAVSMSGMVNASSGQIGNFAISSNNLVGGTTFQLNPTNNSGEIRMGSGFGPDAPDSTTRGIYFAGNGEFGLVEDSSNRIYSSGTGLFVLSSELDVTVPRTDSGNVLLLQGSQNSQTAKIAIGTTAPTAYNNGNGVYFDHTGKFLMGSSTGSRVQFDGSNLIMSASTFLLGGGDQFVSGSNGNLEISSSAYHLSASSFKLGDKLTWDGSTLSVTGAINITSGTGFATADSVSGSFATPAGVSGSAQQYSEGAVASGSAYASASANEVQDNLNTVSGSVATDISASNSNQVQVSASTAANIMTNAEGKIIQTPTPTGTGLFLTGTHLGYANNGGWRTFLKNDGQFLFKIDDDNLISYSSASGSALIVKTNEAVISGSSVSLLTPKFYFGESSNYISGSNGNISIVNTGTTTISGSAVTIETPKFYLGQGSTQYISGSGGNIEISSSMFHLDPKTSKMTLSGSITANDGEIGGFTINSSEISASGLLLKSSGQITASAVSMSGTITADSGKIGGFQISGTQLKQGTSFYLDGNSSGTYFVSSSNFQVTPAGAVTMDSARIGGGTGWQVSTSDTGLIKSNNNAIKLDAHNNKIVVSNAGLQSTDSLTLDGTSGADSYRISVGSLPGNMKNAPFRVSGSGHMFSTGATISGSSITLSTPKFYLGESSQYISGSNGNIEITSSMFHLDPANNKVAISGSITAIDGAIGGFTIANNQLTGSGTAKIATNTGTDRIEIRSSDNTISFFEGTKSSDTEKIFELGKFDTTTVNKYGLFLSGSNTSFGNNMGQLRIFNENALSGISVTDNFFEGTSNIYSVLDMISDSGGSYGRSNIWGETQFKAASLNQNTSGVLVAIGGAHSDNDLAHPWNKSVAVLGVASPQYKTFGTSMPEGAGIPDGQWAMASLGNMYVSASKVEVHSGYIHVSASSDGTFGGYEYGIRIDSANVDQEASIAFSNAVGWGGNIYTVGIDDDEKFKIADSTALGSNTRLTIDTSGFVTIAGGLAIEGFANVSASLAVAVGGSGMSNFGISDGSSSQTITDGNTLTFAAGAGIDVAVTSTDTVTYSAETSTTSNAGVVELATNAETITGTDTGRAVTPDGLTARIAEGAAGNISGSSTSTGSFGALNIDGGHFTSASLAAGGSGTITALNNQTANRLVTIGSTTTELDGEANLTFDGSALTVAAFLDVNEYIRHNGDNNTWIRFQNDNIAIQTGDMGAQGFWQFSSGSAGIQLSGSAASTGSFGTVYAADNVRAGGDVIAYYSSDERLKNNIITIQNPIDKVKQLRGVEYEWNGLQHTYPSGSKDTGIIAQDVRKVLPQIVKEKRDGYLGVRHDRLVGLLVESVKEQQEQIDELKKEVEELKNGSS